VLPKFLYEQLNGKLRRQTLSWLGKAFSQKVWKSLKLLAWF